MALCCYSDDTCSVDKIRRRLKGALWLIDHYNWLVDAYMSVSLVYCVTRLVSFKTKKRQDTGCQVSTHLKLSNNISVPKDTLMIQALDLVLVLCNSSQPLLELTWELGSTVRNAKCA